MSRRRTPLSRWLSDTGTTVQSFAEKCSEITGSTVRVQPIYRWVAGTAVPSPASRRLIAAATGNAVPLASWPPSRQGRRGDLKKGRAA